MAEAGLMGVRNGIRSQISMVMRTPMTALRKVQGQELTPSIHFSRPSCFGRSNKHMTTGYKFIVAFVICFATTGCSFFGDIPPQFRIDQGVAPQYQDEDVRFRTTYYFRVFDVCDGDRDAISSQTPGRIFTDKPVGPYKLRNDSLYRFRMTGKTNAYFNKVRFESGTLRAEQIDMFGATVRPDKDSGDFKLISARQSRDESQLDAQIQEINKLLKIRSGELSTVSGGQSELDNVILDKIQELNDPFQTRLYSLHLTALNYMAAAQRAKDETDKAANEVIPQYTPQPLKAVPTLGTADAKLLNSSLVNEELAKLLALTYQVSHEATEKISATVDQLNKRLRELETDETNRAELAKVQTRLDLALASQKNAQNMASRIRKLERSSTLKVIAQAEPKQAESQDRCNNNQRARRGFQILGPEGFRTFDQDERLLMAFSYDAKPLISLLQELSSRKLSLREGSGPLQEFAKERISFRDALYELSKAKLELERGDPSSSELSAEGLTKRIEERLKLSKESQIQKLDPPSAFRTH